MAKRFIPKRDLVDTLDEDTLKSFINKVLDQVDDCQSPNHHNPNLEKLGHELLRTAFEFGLVNLNTGCESCGGSCHTEPEEAVKLKTTKNTVNGKVIPFKKLH